MSPTISKSYVVSMLFPQIKSYCPNSLRLMSIFPFFRDIYDRKAGAWSRAFNAADSVLRRAWGKTPTLATRQKPVKVEEFQHQPGKPFKKKTMGTKKIPNFFPIIFGVVVVEFPKLGCFCSKLLRRNNNLLYYYTKRRSFVTSEFLFGKIKLWST